MHKITKGIKKKIKGKKDKHREDDLFDPAELEKYRQEKQQQKLQLQEQQLENGEATASTAEESENKDDEWERFKQLTAGVDTVLKQTNEDLDRIKQTSFFQRIKPGQTAQDKEDAKVAVKPESKKQKRWVGFEEGQSEEPEVEDEEEEAKHVNEHTEKGEDRGVNANAKHQLEEEKQEEEEEEEEEEEFEQDDDLFDTSYVDVVTSGDIKLAYIPDSPTEEDKEDEFDPFDTSIADKVIKAEEEEVDAKGRKKKKLVSLGCAVEVLTGKVDKTEVPSVQPLTTAKRRRVVQKRPQDIDLLLGECDDKESVPLSPAAVTTTSPPKTLLDDDVSDIPNNLPSDILGELISSTKHSAVDSTEDKTVIGVGNDILAFTKNDKVTDENVDLSELVAEFDVIDEKVTASKNANELLSPESKDKSNDLVVNDNDELDDEFAALAAESLSKPTNEESFLEEDDPFDTRVASVVLGESQQDNPLNKEIAFDDLLSHSPDICTALSSIPSLQTSEQNSKPVRPPLPKKGPPRPSPPGKSPAAPPGRPPLPGTEPSVFTANYTNNNYANEFADNCSNNNENVEVDPFDTSFAENILPGKAELKLLEKEILSDLQPTANSILTRSDSDFDFDPRADERNVTSIVTVNITAPDRFSVSDLPDEEGDPFGTDDIKLTTLTASHRDLLGGSTTDLSKLSGPIEPNAALVTPDLQDVFIDEIEDPFDTSIVDALAPGKAELKILENELLAHVDPTVVKHRNLSDPEFDPRGEEENTIPKVQTKAPQKPTSLPIVPAVVKVRPDLLIEEGGKGSLIPCKPFGIDIPSPSDRPDLLAGGDDRDQFGKTLTPRIESKSLSAESSVLGSDEIDPFDTSFATNILPGKAELKLIESELACETNSVVQNWQQDLSDPDFDPREHEEKTSERSVTAAVTETSSTIKPTTSLDLHVNRPDLLEVCDEGIAVKTLTPVTDLSKATGYIDELQFNDPFDTSIAENIQPGKAELKFLESELISGEQEVPQIKRSYTDPDFNPRDLNVEKDNQKVPDKPEAISVDRPDLLALAPDEPGTKTLTPRIEQRSISDFEVDPFDTSIADNLGPGKTELKILETELFDSELIVS